MVMWCVLALVQGQTVFVSSAHIAILTKRLSSSTGRLSTRDTIDDPFYLFSAPVLNYTQNKPIQPSLLGRVPILAAPTHESCPLLSPLARRHVSEPEMQPAAMGSSPYLLELICRSMSSIARLRFGGLKSLPAASRGRILLAVFPIRHTRAYHILRRCTFHPQPIVMRGLDTQESRGGV